MNTFFYQLKQMLIYVYMYIYLCLFTWIYIQILLQYIFNKC